MERQIRSCVFETNSSSVHSICINKRKIDKNKLPSSVYFEHGEFDWGFDVLQTEDDRASYLYEMICGICYIKDKPKEELLNKIKDILKTYNIECVFDLNDTDEDGYRRGYIDHVLETQDLLCDLLSDEDKLLRFLFGDSFLVIGNDNECDYDEFMRNHNLGNFEVYAKWN